MLRDRRVPQAEELSQLADRPLAVDQLADDEKTVAVRECLEQLARLIRRPLHDFAIYFHTCVYTQYRIYSQPQSGPRVAHSTATGLNRGQAIKQTEEVSWRNSSYSVQALAEH